MTTVINVKDFGVVGDGVILETSAVQKAIDSLPSEGGTVYFPAGIYRVATLFLKDNMTLFLDYEAEIKGSENIEDYRTDNKGCVEAPTFDACLLYAENKKNITFSGNGCINGMGGSYEKKEFITRRPMLMRLINCRNIRMKDLKLKDPASWGCHFMFCTDIYIHSLEISNRGNINNDGFDFDGCKNVIMSDCNISSGDDSICLKSSTDIPCENFVVTNCIITSNTATIKLGTSSRGGFKNISISNCVFYDCPMGTIKLLMVDGGIMDNINISNITMNNVSSPLFIRLGRRNMKYEIPEEMDHSEDACLNDDEPGSASNIMISNVQAHVTVSDKSRAPIMISGLKDKKIKNIMLSNFNMTFPGGGTKEERNIIVAEDEYRYPEQFYFGILPAYGIYARHIKGLQLSNIQLHLDAPDERESVIIEECESITKYGVNFD